jgi:hypothetical protein
VINFFVQGSGTMMEVSEVSAQVFQLHPTEQSSPSPEIQVSVPEANQSEEEEDELQVESADIIEGMKHEEASAEADDNSNDQSDETKHEKR